MRTAQNRVIVFMVLMRSRVSIVLHILHIIVSIVLTVNGYGYHLSKYTLNRRSMLKLVEGVNGDIMQSNMWDNIYT